MTHGFLKKTREVPEEEIQRALRRMEDWLGRGVWHAPVYWIQIKLLGASLTIPAQSASDKGPKPSPITNSLLIP